MIHLSPAHNAPSVRFPVRRSTVLAMLLTLGAVAGLGAGIAWGLLGAGRMTIWVLALAALVWVACSTSAGLFWTRSPRGDLVWSGSHWSFEYATGVMQHGTLSIHMDFQTYLWICFRPQIGGARWLWLEQPSAPERWSDLRRAVYSRAGTTAADALHSASQSDHSA